MGKILNTVIGNIKNKFGNYDEIVLVTTHINQGDYTENSVTIGIRHGKNSWLSNTCVVPVIKKDGKFKVESIKPIESCIEGHGKLIRMYIEQWLNGS